MKNFLKNMDTIELMILLGVLAVLGLGTWNFTLRKDLEQGKKTYRNAKSTIPAIHALLKQIPELYKARNEMRALGEDTDPSVYFQKQFTEKAQIHYKSFVVGAPREKSIRIRSGGSNKKALEREVSLDFSKASKEYRKPLPRKNLFHALFFTEANSKRWKLRSLQVHAKETEKHRRGFSYPEELSDEWIVKKLSFVSREPDNSRRR